MMTCAVFFLTPGMVTNRSICGAKGRISWSIRAESSSMVADSSSMRVRCMRHKNPWCSLKLPVRAWTRAGVLGRIRPLASCAMTCASSWPLMSASSIARPEAPKISVATALILIPASWSSFSNPWASRLRSTVRAVR